VPREFTLVPTPETERKQKEQLRRSNQKTTTTTTTTATTKKVSFGLEQEQQLKDIRTDAVPTNALSKIKLQLKEANLVDDYNYEQHMKPITGTGTFLSSEGVADPNRDIRAQIVEPDVQEVDRQFEAIALSTNCMEEDVANALFDFEEDEYEEILDDFCITAAQEPDGEQGGSVFDFDAHIEALILKAKLEEKGGGKVVPKGHEWWTKQEQEFQGVKPFNKYGSDDEQDSDDDDDEDSLDREFGGEDLEGLVGHGVVPKLAPNEEMALCEKFEQTLAEYDSDEVGDLDEECYDIKGDKPLEGDVGIEAALDQFIQEQKDENMLIGTRHLPENRRKGGSSKVFVNHKLIDFNELETKVAAEDELEEEKIADVLAEADSFLANPEVELPPEEVLIDGKSYFTMKSSNPWDCESILSTYSNLDNNPAVIDGTSRRRRKKKNSKKQIQDDIPEEEPVQILLSNKTGLPLGVLPERNNGFDDDGLTFASSVNKGEARKKGETKEEKRSRKNLIKEEKKIARIEKKMMREAIQDEFSRRAAPTDDVSGKSVFRYS
jgi:protein LTV1